MNQRVLQRLAPAVSGGSEGWDQTQLCCTSIYLRLPPRQLSTKTEIISRVFAPRCLSEKATKGWKKLGSVGGEGKFISVIFCNCAQFLMKAGKVHCCSKHNEMAHECENLWWSIKSLPTFPNSSLATAAAAAAFSSLQLYLLPFLRSFSFHVSNSENCWSQHKNLCLQLAAAFFSSFYASLLDVVCSTRES